MLPMYVRHFVAIMFSPSKNEIITIEPRSKNKSSTEGQVKPCLIVLTKEVLQTPPKYPGSLVKDFSINGLVSHFISKRYAE